MTFLRSFLAALALALLMGQQAVLLHDIGHAVERHADGAPAEKGCDTHYQCAQLGNAASASPLIIPLESAGRILHQFVEAQGGAQRTRLAYRSQAPPAVSRLA